MTCGIDRQDTQDRFLNSFATESFRDQADRDYIAARLACRSELFPQFLWASHQAIEKYLKGILLYNRIKAVKVKHDLAKGLQLVKNTPVRVELSSRSERFIAHLNEVGQFRYLEVPYHVYGHILVDLDLAIWELRRYCQVLNVFGKLLPASEQALLTSALATVENSDKLPRYKFRLHGGLLEKILDDRHHPSRAALLWQNPVFGSRHRKTVRVKRHMHAQNPLLSHYPEMLDALLEYVYIPPAVASAYRAHLVDSNKP